jgi:hypothetical protein
MGVLARAISSPSPARAPKLTPVHTRNAPAAAQVFGYTLALYGLNMYHAYRALRGQDMALSALALHAATDNGMKVMAAGMMALCFFFAVPG